MLTAYAQTALAATRAAMSEHGRPEGFARALSCLTRGEAPEDAIADRLLAEYAIAGTPEECLAQTEVYAEAGVTELAIAPIGERPGETSRDSAARSSSEAGSLLFSPQILLNGLQQLDGYVHRVIDAKYGATKRGRMTGAQQETFDAIDALKTIQRSE